MDKFTATVTPQNALGSVVLQGVLDENAVLKTIDLKPYSEIRLDLREISRVTSVGIRTWIQWVSSLDRGKKYSICNCSRVFVNQANLILGMIPGWIEIESFELPYYCEHCSHSFSTMLKLNGNRAVPKDLPETTTCTKCGLLAELDTLPQKYFHFLQQK